MNKFVERYIILQKGVHYMTTASGSVHGARIGSMLTSETSLLATVSTSGGIGSTPSSLADAVSGPGTGSVGLAPMGALSSSSTSAVSCTAPTPYVYTFSRTEVDRDHGVPIHVSLANHFDSLTIESPRALDDRIKKYVMGTAVQAANHMHLDPVPGLSERFTVLDKDSITFTVISNPWGGKGNLRYPADFKK